VAAETCGLAVIQFAGNSPAGTTELAGIVLPLFPPGTLNPRLARLSTVAAFSGNARTVPDAPLPIPL